MSEVHKGPVAAQEPPRDDAEPEAGTPALDEVAALTEPAVTSAEDWSDAGEEGTVLTLPSGNVWRLKRPPVLWLVATGRIPPQIVAAMKHHEADKVDFSTAEKDLMLDWLICEAAVEPAISMGKRKDAVHVGRLSAADKEAVINGMGLLTQLLGMMR